MTELLATQLTQAAFDPFGDVLDCDGAPDLIINDGMCGRFHDRAALDFSDGRAGLSLFDAKPRALPYQFCLVERHPLGSQAFLPLQQAPFLVIVAFDEGGVPGRPSAFLTAPGQGVNFHRGTWHGVLTPLSEPARFAVIDRIGDGTNLEEYTYPAPWTVIAPSVSPS